MGGAMGSAEKSRWASSPNTLDVWMAALLRVWIILLSFMRSCRAG
jgi:hypothetical protein